MCDVIYVVLVCVGVSPHRARTAAIVAILIVMFQVFILLLLEFINVSSCSAITITYSVFTSS